MIGVSVKTGGPWAKQGMLNSMPAMISMQLRIPIQVDILVRNRYVYKALSYSRNCKFV